MPKRTVRPTLIVVHTPHFDLGLGIGERCELMHIQTFVSKRPFKRFDKGIFLWFSRSNEVKLNTSAIRPVFQNSRLEFGPMIRRDGPRSRHAAQRTIVNSLSVAASSRSRCWINRSL